ncbi:hypothetical protein OROHE_020732 [Orobanche hederae]
MQSFSNEQSPNNLTNFYHNAPTGDIRLFMQSFSNEQSPNEPNLTNFYHNAPTGDIRLFMQSFSNEQSPNVRISTTMLLQVI